MAPTLQALSPYRFTEIWNSSNTQRAKKKTSIVFPWWCLFIAYTLSSMMALVSILLIVARGIEFGDMKVRKWLGSLSIGFFSSVLLFQPIKVCLLFRLKIHMTAAC